MARSIWGPDARTFDPSRWLEPDSTLSGSEKSTSSRSIPREGPGVWPDIMTFIDGPRRCVGYKLALIEVKITIFNLVRAFVFSPVEGKKIYKWNL
jgi:cytochrome P450